MKSDENLEYIEPNLDASSSSFGINIGISDSLDNLFLSLLVIDITLAFLLLAISTQALTSAVFPEYEMATITSSLPIKDNWVSILLISK